MKPDKTKLSIKPSAADETDISFVKLWPDGSGAGALSVLPAGY